MPDGAPPVLGVAGVEDLVEIGRGGFGVVYRGHQATFGRQVAVKVLLTPDARGGAVERWQREITAMGRLSNHPNIVAVYDAGVTDEGFPYMVMPYVAGGSLLDRLMASGPVDAGTATLLGTRLAAALAAAHDAGVLHRDVKPANVLLSEYGEPQLSDFGIARLVDSTATATTGVMATVAYAAPEVLSGAPASASSDVYGLGATLFASLAGSTPFAGEAGESLVATVGRIATQPVPDLRRRGVPDGLATVIEAALAKHPEQRIASADEMKAQLEATATEPITGDDATERLGAVVAGVPLAPQPTPDPTAVLPASVAEHQQVVPAPPAPSPSPGHVGARSYDRMPGSDTPAARRGLLALGLVALLVVAVIAGFLITRAVSDPSEASGPTQPATSEPAPAPNSNSEPSSSGSVPESTGTSVSEPDPTTPESEPTTPAGPIDARDAEAAVTTYYDLIEEGELDEGYARLSPRFRADQTLEQFENFWTSIETVDLVGRPTADGNGRVDYVLDFVASDERRTREQVTVTLVRAEDGALLIDTYDVRRSESRDGVNGEDDDD